MARGPVTILTTLIAVSVVAGSADAQPGPRDAIEQSASEPATPGRYRRPRGDNPLPDGKVARGTRNIAAAWFSDPTTRYRHFALGSEHEPETLVVSTSDRRVYRLKLPTDSVFEDREPRIADIKGDGQDEIIVVRSYLRQGAALAIIAVRGDGLEIIAETPPIGEHFRWLNPAGIADFDGDGLADLAIPSFDRRSLRVLGFRNGRVREIDRIALPAGAAEDFELVQRHGRTAVRVGLNGGRSVVVTP